MFNPNQIMQMFAPVMGTQNPMQTMMQSFGNNPNFSRAMQMMQGKTPPQMEQVVRNMCNQTGVNFDELMGAFSRMGGFK